MPRQITILEGETLLEQVDFSCRSEINPPTSIIQTINPPVVEPSGQLAVIAYQLDPTSTIAELIIDATNAEANVSYSITIPVLLSGSGRPIQDRITVVCL